jgi:hypothetical protein
MKTLQNTIKIALVVISMAALAVSCIPKEQSMGGAGQTLVKLSPDGFAMLAVDAKTTAQTGILFEVRRDVPSQTALNATTTAVLSYDTDGSILAAYNTANGTNFIPLPTTLATVSPALVSGQISVTFAAGDFAKSVMVNIPSSASFDFSKNYALAFKLVSVTGSGTVSAAVGKTIVAQVLAKNRWDGVYTVTGTYEDYIYAPGTYAGYYPKTIQLQTTGSTTCARYDADYATYGYIFDPSGAGTSASYFGNWYPAFTFDVTTNKVVDCFNTFADPLPRQRTALLYTGAGAINQWNASNKSMDVTFQLKALTTSPQIRNLVTEHYTYKGPR